MFDHCSVSKYFEKTSVEEREMLERACTNAFGGKSK